MIFRDLVSETIFAVVVDSSRCAYQSTDSSGIFFGEHVAGMLFYKPEEDRLEAEAGFPEHFFRKSEERSGEVTATAIDTDNGSGQEYQLGIGYYFIIFQINRDMSPAVMAKINGSSFQLP